MREKQVERQRRRSGVPQSEKPSAKISSRSFFGSLVLLIAILFASSLLRKTAADNSDSPETQPRLAGADDGYTSSKSRGAGNEMSDYEQQALLRPLDEAELAERESAGENEEVSHDMFAQAELKGLAAIRAAGLEWPARTFEGSDGIIDHNLREREQTAFAQALVNPAQAVEFMKAQIQFEEDKYVTRKWQEPLRDLEGEENSEVRANYLSEMFHSIPDRHLGIVLSENLDAIVSDPSLGERAIEAGLQREDTTTRYRALALLLDQHPFRSSPNVTQAYAELTKFIGTPAEAQNDLFFEVNEVLLKRSQPTSD